jgi:hypothetical protein
MRSEDVRFSFHAQEPGVDEQQAAPIARDDQARGAPFVAGDVR